MTATQCLADCGRKMWQSWQRFWFAPRDLFNVSVFRAVLGVTMFWMYWIRFQDVEDFFFNTGLLPASHAFDVLPRMYQSPFPLFFHSDAANYWGHVALLVGLALFTLGILGRSLTWALWILHIGFMQRNFGLVYGADLFANFWLLYLCFINHNKHMNILNLWKPKSLLTVPDVSSDLLSSAFTRLVQIQLCGCYAYTGIEKLKGLQWWEGTAFWYTLGMRELINWDLTFLRQLPIAIGLLSMLPLLFEVYFPFAMGNRRLRPWWLIFGVLFHLGTALVMSLWFFCLVMMAAYFVFLDSQKLRQCVAVLRRRVLLFG